MQIQIEEAFAPVDLWALPTPGFSRWFTRLDWYMNWQMSKGLAYGGLHLPAETYRIAEQYDVSVPKAATPSASATLAPLLIDPFGRVPARRCLVVDGAGSLKVWLGEIAELSQRLQALEIRIFLPKEATLPDAEKAWRNYSIQAHFTTDLLKEI